MEVCKSLFHRGSWRQYYATPTTRGWSAIRASKRCIVSLGRNVTGCVSPRICTVRWDRTVSNYRSCRRHQPSEKYQQLLNLVPSSAPPECIAFDIFGPLMRAKQVYRFMIDMTDRFINLMRALPVTIVITAHVTFAAG